MPKKEVEEEQPYDIRVLKKLPKREEGQPDEPNVIPDKKLEATVNEYMGTADEIESLKKQLQDQQKALQDRYRTHVQPMEEKLQTLGTKMQEQMALDEDVNLLFNRVGNYNMLIINKVTTVTTSPDVEEQLENLFYV